MSSRNSDGLTIANVQALDFLRFPKCFLSPVSKKFALPLAAEARTGASFAQVCGSPGNAMRFDRGSLGLRAGKHALHVEGLHSASEGAPRLLWEGPALPLTDVPTAAYSHPRQDVVRQGIGK